VGSVDHGLKKPQNKLLSVENLSISFPLENKKHLTIANNISFHIKQEEVLGLVGESGEQHRSK
jgi:ABC-type glutathione transport system ATPase component